MIGCLAQFFYGLLRFKKPAAKEEKASGPLRGTQVATWPGLGPAKDPQSKGGGDSDAPRTDTSYTWHTSMCFTTIGRVGSVPLRGTCRLIAKEDGSGEPDPVKRLSEAVHCDGAHDVLKKWPFLRDLTLLCVVAG